ncbi:MAG TPA: hypothetical protein VK812_06960 [Candidatus Binatus sp.]|nr:hypothetical protein [Candidatus Binatus sp.]
MKCRTLCSVVSMTAVLVLAVSSIALAQGPPPAVHLSGLINDYSPVSGVNGPWEMRGEWSLDLRGDSGTATFSATLNMTHSDYWVVLNPGAADDNSATTGRHPHAHHITLANATVTPITTGTGGFEVSGPVYVTNDGNPAPFMKNCTSPTTPCTLTVDITGGTIVQLSNITLTFGGPTTGPTVHFGTQAIHGVVRKTN